MIFALLMAALTWPLYTLLSLALLLCGLPLISLALLCNATEMQPSKYFDSKSIVAFKWAIMAPYQNWEDGIYPPNYVHQHPTWSPFKVGFIWTALRNPISGLRWAPLLSFLIDRAKVGYIGTLGPVDPAQYELKQPSFVYVWHGAYSGLWWHFKIRNKLYRLQLGHKLYAADCKPQDYGYRKYGTGFSAAFKPVDMGQNKN